MPRAFKEDLGYTTAVIGKNHFGYNRTSSKCVSHSYDHMEMYDYPDSDYKDWFQLKYPGQKYFPTGTDYNTWWAEPFGF